MRSAETFRHAQRLRLSSDNVCSRRFENTHRHGLADIDDRQRLVLPGNRCDVVRVFDGSEEIRRLHHDCSHVVTNRGVQFCEIETAIFHIVYEFDFEAEILDVGLYDRAIFRMKCLCNQEAFLSRYTLRHQNRFGDGRAPVIERGVGDIHTCELGDVGLELENSLQRALGNLRLIRRIRGIELGS